MHTRVLSGAAALGVALLVAGPRGQAAREDVQAIQRMAATERAFAAATAQIGVRDGFLTFFAADAVQVVTGANGAETRVQPARPGLEGRPLSPLPLQAKLIWEPFTGHVSSDGSLGWLTGGYVTLSEAEPRTIINQGAYFSVWKRLADGTWRVWLDEGISLPSVWQDASPFRVAPDPDAGIAGAAAETVPEAEAAIAAGLDGWRSRLSEHARLHRDGVMPLVGRLAVTEWASAWRDPRFALAEHLTADSGDLGIAIGGYDVTTSTGPEHGMYVRVWKRDVTGRWRIVFETSRPAA
jgi:ketosteroid isomerase-like protein